MRQGPVAAPAGGDGSYEGGEGGRPHHPHPPRGGGVERERHRPGELRPAMPAVPPSPPPLTACGATAAPPQTGRTALICAAHDGKLDCLDHLIAKGANLNAQSMVRRGPAAAWRRGRGVGVGSERLGDAARRRLPRCPAVPRDGIAPLVPLRPSAAAPRRRPAASWWPSAARLACKLSERGRRGGLGWAGVSHPPMTPAARRSRSPACVGPPSRLGRARWRCCTTRLSSATLPASSRWSRRGPTRASRTR